ncbi:MAG: Uma2 family endonuclease [Bryobacterales bacterium]|nr:Uma2 family endonuclease [Bryobacterales bacterium]
MATATLVPVETYLNTAYSPDVEYVDGELVERNLGETDHSGVQGALVAMLFSLRKQGGLRVYPEQRVQVKPDRFRVPDVCAITGKPDGPVLRQPPLLVIEILSKDDTMLSMTERIDDYLDFGVPHVWLIDPALRRGFVCTREGLRVETVLRTADPQIEVPLAEIFSVLD